MQFRKNAAATLLQHTRKKADKIIKSILDEIDQYVLPAYEVLNSREAILAYRKDYPLLDNMSHHISLEECMIYGYLGNIEKAKQLFKEYYRCKLKKFLAKM